MDAVARVDIHSHIEELQQKRSAWNGVEKNPLSCGSHEMNLVIPASLLYPIRLIFEVLNFQLEVVEEHAACE